MAGRNRPGVAVVTASGDVLDDREEWDRMQASRVAEDDPEAVAYYNARLQAQVRARACVCVCVCVCLCVCGFTCWHPTNNRHRLLCFPRASPPPPPCF